MRYDNLPIYKSAMELCVYVETIVKGFDKYHKYSIGQDLRELSKELLFLIHRANILADKSQKLGDLRDKCEDMKMIVSLAKELKAYKSFVQFEHLSKLTIEVCRQSSGWLNSQKKQKCRSL
jgi:histidyl-tRNA synthetase